mgnify:CR=1 FL=1
MSGGPGPASRASRDPTGLAIFNGTITSPSFNKSPLGRVPRQRALRRAADSAGTCSASASTRRATPSRTARSRKASSGPFPCVRPDVGSRRRHHAVRATSLVSLCCGADRINHYKFDAAGNADLFEVIQGNGLSNPHDMSVSELGRAVRWPTPGMPSGNNYFGKTISRFLFDAEMGAPCRNGQFTATGLNGAIGLTFTPWDELFVSAIRSAGAGRALHVRRGARPRAARLHRDSEHGRRTSSSRMRARSARGIARPGSTPDPTSRSRFP